jgi:hypothetical protein
MPYKVEITSCSHDPSKTIGYTEGKIDRREFVASWATFQPLGGLFYDTWLDTTLTQDRAIAKALNDMNAVPKLLRTGKHKSSNKFSPASY